MEGGSNVIDFVCHDSTTHAYNGGMGRVDFWQGVWTLKKEVLVTHDINGNGSHPSLGTLNRGDIVAYYKASGTIKLMHSQTCTGSGTETFGANNEPLPFNGHPDLQSWIWATSTAGDWANAIWLPGTGVMPVTIKVFSKP